jgi:hypothetical protein
LRIQGQNSEVNQAQGTAKLTKTSEVHDNHRDSKEDTITPDQFAKLSVISQVFVDLTLDSEECVNGRLRGAKHTSRTQVNGGDAGVKTINQENRIGVADRSRPRQLLRTVPPFQRTNLISTNPTMIP